MIYKTQIKRNENSQIIVTVEYQLDNGNFVEVYSSSTIRDDVDVINIKTSNDMYCIAEYTMLDHMMKHYLYDHDMLYSNDLDFTFIFDTVSNKIIVLERDEEIDISLTVDISDKTLKEAMNEMKKRISLNRICIDIVKITDYSRNLYNNRKESFSETFCK
jgi:hypothetical protein